MIRLLQLLRVSALILTLRAGSEEACSTATIRAVRPDCLGSFSFNSQNGQGFNGSSTLSSAVRTLIVQTIFTLNPQRSTTAASLDDLTYSIVIAPEPAAWLVMYSALVLSPSAEDGAGTNQTSQLVPGAINRNRIVYGTLPVLFPIASSFELKYGLRVLEAKLELNFLSKFR
jgi:hypothetical protein